MDLIPLGPLTNDDVADILALLDSLPYDEFDLEPPRFRLTLRRTPAGWTRSTYISAPADVGSMAHRSGSSRTNGTSASSSLAGAGRLNRGTKTWASGPMQSA